MGKEPKVCANPKCHSPYWKEPRREVALDEHLEIRVGAREKQVFVNAAELAGISLSSWVRERLRQVAIKEREDAEQLLRDRFKVSEEDEEAGDGG